MTDVTELLERLDALRERAIAADEQLEAYREKGDPRPDMDEEYAPVAVLEYHASLDGHYTLLRAALMEMREESERLRADLMDARDIGSVSRCKACERIGVVRGYVCFFCGHDPSDTEALAKGGGR